MHGLGWPLEVAPYICHQDNQCLLVLAKSIPRVRFGEGCPAGSVGAGLQVMLTSENLELSLLVKSRLDLDC